MTKSEATPSNAETPMLAGASPRKDTDLRKKQSKKAYSSILLTPLPMVMLVRLLHPEKEYFSILATPSGIIKLVNAAHPKKA